VWRYCNLTNILSTFRCKRLEGWGFEGLWNFRGVIYLVSLPLSLQLRLLIQPHQTVCVCVRVQNLSLLYLTRHHSSSNCWLANPGSLQGCLIFPHSEELHNEFCKVNPANLVLSTLWLRPLTLYQFLILLTTIFLKLVFIRIVWDKVIRFRFV
jgi:hypothetical protein